MAEEKTVHNVELGSPFTISLEENPTTGYSWDVTFDREALGLLSNKFEPDSLGAIGSGRTRTFVFFGRKLGTHIIRFEYRRKWEKKGAIRTKEYTVIVQ